MFNVTNNFEFLRNKDFENFAKWLEELSDKEKELQQKLRQKYIDNVKRNFRAQLDGIEPKKK